MKTVVKIATELTPKKTVVKVAEDLSAQPVDPQASEGAQGPAPHPTSQETQSAINKEKIIEMIEDPHKIVDSISVTEEAGGKQKVVIMTEPQSPPGVLRPGAQGQPAAAAPAPAAPAPAPVAAKNNNVQKLSTADYPESFLKHIGILPTEEPKTAQVISDSLYNNVFNTLSGEGVEEKLSVEIATQCKKIASEKLKK